MAASGQKAFELAFILAPNGGGCSPTWGGTAPVSSDTAVAERSSARSVPPAATSPSRSAATAAPSSARPAAPPAATAAAYQQVITKYSLKAIDFDLEEPEYENTTAINNEIGAAQILQQNNPGLYVSITVPGTTSGTGYFGQNVLNTAKGLGFTPANYSIMPFDGGFNGSASQISALEAFHTHADEHVRLEQRDRVQPRGRVADERPVRHRRDLHPDRLPERAELRDRATA